MPRGIVIPQVDNSWKWGTGHGRVEPGEHLASRIISTAGPSVRASLVYCPSHRFRYILLVWCKPLAAGFVACFISKRVPCTI